MGSYIEQVTLINAIDLYQSITKKYNLKHMYYW